MPIANETVLTLGLVGLGVYFSVMLVRGLHRYLKYKRLRPTALLTWPAVTMRSVRWLLVMGAVAAGLTLLNSWLGRPFHHVYGQAVMALYFIVMVPLLTRIRVGLYRDGVWADAGFVRYDQIRRMAFRETPEIVLVLVPRRGWRPFQLPVPRGEYGAVRKLLEDQARARVLKVETSILGL